MITMIKIPIVGFQPGVLGIQAHPMVRGFSTSLGFYMCAQWLSFDFLSFNCVGAFEPRQAQAMRTTISPGESTLGPRTSYKKLFFLLNPMCVHMFVCISLLIYMYVCTRASGIFVY